ncbi:MAG: HEPN domain-containing protein [Paludibacteraceae bacterium]|nr:HEPN domain-containing protein [Paludibacteraceae bacterium]
MSLTDEERKTIVSLQLEKAHNNFDQIPLLCKVGYWDNVANRLYYSLFHAVSALLIHDGHEVSSHRGAVSSFGQYYIVTGVFSIEDGRHYSRMQSLREKADYNCTYYATEKDIFPKIEPTKQLIEKIELYIGK